MKNRITSNIAFDIDEVMVEFVNPVRDLITKHGYKLSQTIDCHDLTKHIEPEISRNQLYKLFNLIYQDPNSTPIIEGAQQLCTNLYVKTTDPVVFITMRSANWATETHQLVKKFCKVPYVLVFADPQIGKLPYLNGIHYFVDDRRKTIMELAEAGKTVLAPVRGWNENIREDFEYADSIVRIKSLKEITKNLGLFIH